MRTEILKQQIEELRAKRSLAIAKGKFKDITELSKQIVELETELAIEVGQENLEKAKQSGMFERASRFISLIQLVLCEANNLMGEVEDMFAENKIVIDEIVVKQREYYKSADKYFKAFDRIVKSNTTEENRLDYRMFEDLQQMDDMIKIWASLKEQPKPQSLMPGCTKAAKQANGRSQMCTKCGMRYNPETIMCKACNRSFVEGFEKGARWLENKRVERIMNKNNEQAKETKETHILEEKN